jgi:F0F1-type ATP synthase beta subunit
VAQQVKQILQRNKDLQEIIAILRIDVLADEDRLGGPGAQDPAVPVTALPCG